MAWNEELHNSLRFHAKRTPYYNHLGINFEKLAEGHAVLSLRIKEELTNPMGIAHGGAITSLADAAMGNAVRTLGKLGVTIDLNINFLAPGKIGDILTAEAKVISQGNRIVVLETKINNDHGKQIAVARATFMIIGDYEL